MSKQKSEAWNGNYPEYERKKAKRVGEFVMNHKQRETIVHIYHRGTKRPAPTLMEFIDSAAPILGTADGKGECAWGVNAYGMMHGIEPDGSSHT